MLTVQHNGDLCQVAVSGEMTIYQAEELGRELLPLLGHHKLEVDLEQVTDIDTSGIQLLLMANKQLSLEVVNPSPAVQAVIEQLGLTACLQPGDQSDVATRVGEVS